MCIAQFSPLNMHPVTTTMSQLMPRFLDVLAHKREASVQGHSGEGGPSPRREGSASQQMRVGGAPEEGLGPVPHGVPPAAVAAAS